MPSDYPDGQRSNVPSEQQDLSYRYSHPFGMIGWATVAANKTADFVIESTDLSHLYSLHGLLFSSCPDHGMYYLITIGTLPVCSVNVKGSLYWPLPVESKFYMSYGDFIQCHVVNLGPESETAYVSAQFSSIPMPIGYARRPQSFFVLDDPHIAHGVTFYPVNYSNFDITSYDWDWGDGSAHSTEESPSHSYTAAGIYTITLTVWNGSLYDVCSTLIYVS